MKFKECPPFRPFTKKDNHGVDLTGKRFTRLTILGMYTEKRYYVVAVCDCGYYVATQIRNVVDERSRSCGCLHREIAAMSKFVHGLSATPEYRSWKGMRNRCLNENCYDYQAYGGSGITVCERWANSFENFLEDMGKMPGKGYSIDRFPDKKGNYEPGNCRWATSRQQCINRSSTVWLYAFGFNLPLTEWVDITGIPNDTMHRRLERGWSAEETVGLPVLPFSGRRTDMVPQCPIQLLDKFNNGEDTGKQDSHNSISSSSS